MPRRLGFPWYPWCGDDFLALPWTESRPLRTTDVKAHHTAVLSAARTETRQLYGMPEGETQESREGTEAAKASLAEKPPGAKVLTLPGGGSLQELWLCHQPVPRSHAVLNDSLLHHPCRISPDGLSPWSRCPLRLQLQRLTVSHGEMSQRPA